MMAYIQRYDSGESFCGSTTPGTASAMTRLSDVMEVARTKLSIHISVLVRQLMYCRMSSGRNMPCGSTHSNPVLRRIICDSGVSNLDPFYWLSIF